MADESIAADGGREPVDVASEASSSNKNAKDDTIALPAA